MTTEELSPIFAKETYNMLGNKSKDDRIDIINKNIEKTGYHAVKEKSNRDIVYYENPENKSVFISHRGTDFNKKNDVSADLYFALGKEKHSKEFKTRRNKTSELVKNIPDDYKLNMSGHSYGGASINDTIRNKKNVREKLNEAHTYNSAFSPFTTKLKPKIKDDLDKKITHHRTSTDAVSSASQINRQFGKMKTYKTKNDKHLPKTIPKILQPIFNTLDQFKSHSLNNFL